MAGKRNRSTAGEEGQLAPLNEVEVVDTTTGEVIDVTDPDFGAQETFDEDAQGGCFDEAQESYDDESQAPPGFEDSQVRPSRGKGE